MKIGIIGGGIIGLTTGVALAEAGHDVQIYTQEAFEAVTSHAAGAISYPFGVEETERALAWWARTDEVLRPLLGQPGTGVLQSHWRRLSENETIEAPYWFSRVGGRFLGAEELPPGYRSGIAADFLMMGVDEYVPYLMQRLKAAGGRYDIRAIAAPLEIAGDFDALVNATGIYARQFSADDTVYPARGQAVVVKNPGVHRHTALEGRKFYCYPRGGQVLLGGSFDVNEYDRTPDEDLTREILAWVGSVEPLLKNPEVIDVRVGLRPMRPTVRLEREVLRGGRPLIHNYGHGGAGYTLSWGCAFDVLKLLETA
jgi:D-amino-acid oxidase